MSSPTFFTDGSTPRANASAWTILQKILGAAIDGGGSTGGGSVTSGHGAPSSTPSGAALYYDLDTGNIYQWSGSAWS